MSDVHNLGENKSATSTSNSTDAPVSGGEVMSLAARRREREQQRTVRALEVIAAGWRAQLNQKGDTDGKE